MFAFALAGAFILLATATPAPSASPAAQSGPLREVVFNVTYGDRITSGSVSYGGPAEDSRATGDHGTVKVDIMAIQDNNLGIEVTETMWKGGGPFTFKGVVAPDGTVTFPSRSISEVTRELLQYFATGLIPPDKVDVGSSWSASFVRYGADVKDQYQVTKIDGDLLTLHALQNVSFHGYSGTAKSDSTIILKPVLLVPVSGDIRKVVDGTSVSASYKEEMTMHFERVSDSRDAPGK
jgi:hypothetical protein